MQGAPSSLLSRIALAAAWLAAVLRGTLSRAWPHLRHPSRRTLVCAALGPPALLMLYTLVLIPFTPGIRDIRNAKQEQPARVVSADGKTITEFKRGVSDWVKLSEVSPNVIAALIATEDRRFYEHHGLDWRRTVGAMLYTLAGDLQGGSTLTQQLARNLYPEEIGRSASLTRKLKEAITAVKIEALYSKDEILETYLNTVPFLYNAYGIEMAARTYFDTSARKLDLLEAATLVGMLKGNSYYNPVQNPERSLERRNTVLAQMVKVGKLAAEKFDGLKSKPLKLDFERQEAPEGPAPFFAQQVRKQVIAWADRNDYNIYADGLVIHTTLDLALQNLANRAVARQTGMLQQIANTAWSPRNWAANAALSTALVRESDSYRKQVAAGLAEEEASRQLLADVQFMRALREDKTRLEVGFLALDPRNGQIKAWVGGRDFGTSAFDHVQQARRQPGSTFKPFVYGAAFLQGMKPGDTLVDEAVEIPLGGGEVWRPNDGGPPSGRMMSLADGLAYSKNTLTAQVMQRVGPDKVIRLAQALGVRQSKLEAVPALALGTSPVSLKEMVSAYATLADAGRFREPQLITRIEDRQGKRIAEFSAVPPETTLPADTAYTLIDTLRGVIDRGTGRAIRSRYGIRADVAGKTGTTQDNTDGWFILAHPQLVAGAWVGFNDGRITLRSDYWGQGAHSALPIVGEFLQQALRERLIDAKTRFTPPQNAGMLSSLLQRIHGWLPEIFPAESSPQAPPRRPDPIPEASPPIEDLATQSAPESASPPLSAEPPTPAESMPAPAPAATSAPAAAGQSAPP